MTFQEFADRIAVPCAVMSVERTAGGARGMIRFHRANQAFKDLLGGAFENDMPYLLDDRRDPRLVEFFYRAAFLGQRIRDYTEAVSFGGWGDIVISPLEREREDLGYCQFVIELTGSADPDRMATVSQRTSMGVLRTCLSLRDGGSFRESAGRVLEDILAETGALAGRIVRTDSAARTLTELCCAVRPDAPCTEPREGRAPYELLTDYSDVEGITRTVIVTNASELEYLRRYNNPNLARAIELFGLTSFLLTPLRRGRRVLGFLYLADFRIADVVDVKELVELDCFFLGLELSNALLRERMERMSRTDELTGLNNRNAMLRRMHARSERGADTPYGVVNIDLNGLKAVNDSEGHEAGDRLLIEAARLLTGVFDREDIFRTGGDEFIVLAEGMPEKTYLRCMERLKELRRGGLSFALGGCWSEGMLPVSEALRCADARMYSDKQDHYRRNSGKPGRQAASEIEVQ